MLNAQAFKNALILCLFADGGPVYAQDARGFWVRVSEGKMENDQVLAMNSYNGSWFVVKAWEVRPNGN